MANACKLKSTAYIKILEYLIRKNTRLFPYAETYNFLHRLHNFNINVMYIDLSIYYAFR